MVGTDSASSSGDCLSLTENVSAVIITINVINSQRVKIKTI